MLPHQPARHPRIGPGAAAGKPGRLTLAGRVHRRPHLLTRRARSLGGEITVGNGWHLELDVDPVEERPGDLPHVFLHLRRRALALAARVSPIAAGAGVEGGDEDELGREARRRFGAADRHRAILERLPEDLERPPVELGELVKKEDAVVGEADFARHRHGAAADEAGFADRMMRSAEGAGGKERLPRREEPERTVDPRRLDRFGRRERREDRRDPLGEHRLAAAWRAEHGDVVPSSRRHTERPLRRLLPADISEVDVVGGILVEPLPHPRRRRADLKLAGEKPHRFVEIGHRDDFDILDNGRFGSARRRHDHAAEIFLPRGRHRHRESAAGRPRRALER